MIEDKILVLAAIGVKAPIVEERDVKPALLQFDNLMARRNLVSVDIVEEQRRANALHADEGLHQAISNMRASAMAPATADAATVAGLARCERTRGP